MTQIGPTRTRRPLSLMPHYTVLTLLALFSLGPLLILFFNAFKTTQEIGLNPLGPPLSQLRWQNFPDAWQAGNYSITVRNSAILAVATATGVMVISGLAAYSLVFLKPPGSAALTLYFLVGTTLPAQLFMVPLFFLWHRIGLMNTRQGIIIIYWALWSPFATFLLRSFLITIPGEFQDAARVDGASDWQVFWRVIVPIAKPGFFTVGLIVSLWAWNEFLFAVTFLHNPMLKPISTSLYAFLERYNRDWGLTSAAGIMMILPTIVIFLVFRRRFIQGLTQGGLKA